MLIDVQTKIPARLRIGFGARAEKPIHTVQKSMAPVKYSANPSNHFLEKKSPFLRVKRPFQATRSLQAGSFYRKSGDLFSSRVFPQKVQHPSIVSQND
jgi:hypothetical protein